MKKITDFGVVANTRQNAERRGSKHGSVHPQEMVFEHNFDFSARFSGWLIFLNHDM